MGDWMRAAREFVRLLWLQARQRSMAQRVLDLQAKSEKVRQQQIAHAQAYDAVRAESARKA